MPLLEWYCRRKDANVDIAYAIELRNAVAMRVFQRLTPESYCKSCAAYLTTYGMHTHRQWLNETGLVTPEVLEFLHAHPHD